MTKKSNSLIHKKIFKVYKIKSRRLLYHYFFIIAEPNKKSRNYWIANQLIK